MLRIIGYAGPWALPLATLTVVLAVLIVRGIVRTMTDRKGDPAQAAGLGSAILFWGFVAAALGFLGQCAALYKITSIVVSAPALSPELLAEGFGGSFVPTLWGVGLLLVAGLAWLALFGVGRVGTRAFVLLALPLIALAGCGDATSQAPADVTQGVWVGDAGVDKFLFDLDGAAPDSLFGVVHVLHAGKKSSELPITRASYHAPDLEMFIQSTNATYKGRVELDKGRIRGGLSFGGQPGSQMELRWSDPSDLPGYRALAGTGPYAYREPTAGDDGWQVASPEDVGLDRGALEALVDAVARDEAGLIQSLLVVRNGKLVLDEYFHGYGPADVHPIASVTKSVSGLLVGAALDRGMIPGLDTPLLHFFTQKPSVVGPGWEKETLHHLTSMSMGLDWTREEMDGVHGTGGDFFSKVLGRKVADLPGTRWDYASANVDLLAGVLREATGEHADVFAKEVLFAPLGIRTYDWEYGKVDGYPLMDGSLQLRPRDMAKIGTMVANGGRWDGKQVIGESWIQEFTRLHFQTGEPLAGYGDLWWLGELPSGGGVEPMIVANGLGSQFIVIFPGLDMVVVTTGGNESNGRHLDIGPVLARYLLSTV
jgi:CubicO group peptidase (beta-lactamase class C family)